MPPKATVEEIFDDDTDLPLPPIPLPKQSLYIPEFSSSSQSQSPQPTPSFSIPPGPLQGIPRAPVSISGAGKKEDVVTDLTPYKRYYSDESVDQRLMRNTDGRLSTLSISTLNGLMAPDNDVSLAPPVYGGLSRLTWLKLVRQSGSGVYTNLRNLIREIGIIRAGSKFNGKLTVNFYISVQSQVSV